jgi:hypothetical protein
METEQIKKLAVEAKAAWIDANFGSKKQVDDWVKRKLDAGATDVLMKLLGFEKGYNDSNYRLDHCNGRSGNSVVGEYLQSSCRMAVEKWAAANMAKLPDLDTKVILELHAEYQKYLRDAVKIKIKAHAEMKAEQIAKDLVAGI